MSDYAEHAPPSDLAPYVQCFWTRTTAAPLPRPAHRVLPDGAIDILFSLGALPEGEREALRGTVVGTMTEPLVLAPQPCEEFVGVRFRPGRARPLLGFDAFEMTDRNAALEDVFGSSGRRLLERVREADTIARRLAIVQQDLRARLARAGASDPYVDAIVAEALANGGRLDTVEMARRTGISPQLLRRRFKQFVGVGPKTFLRVVRMQRAVARLQRTRKMDWAGLAALLGHSDQSHLSREFRELTGLSPEEFRRQA